LNNPLLAGVLAVPSMCEVCGSSVWLVAVVCGGGEQRERKWFIFYTIFVKPSYSFGGTYAQTPLDTCKRHRKDATVNYMNAWPLA
jgi:hypothetical protein